MAMQQVLTAGLMTHLLFLGALAALICLVLLGTKNQVKQFTSSDSSEKMIGLYYQLASGVDLFICKANRDKYRLITNLIKTLVKHPSEAKDVIDINSFQSICNEAFDTTKLHTKLIASKASVYPMYHNTGILENDPDVGL